MTEVRGKQNITRCERKLLEAMQNLQEPGFAVSRVFTETQDFQALLRPCLLPFC